MNRRADPRRWLALALLGTAFFMVILDGTIVYVAVPPIEKELGFSAGDVQWVMSAYLLSFGGLLLLGGRSADLLGRRRMFMAGLVLFTTSSLLCGFAGDAEVLVAARIVQGVAAAIMTPSALSLLVATFDEGSERNKALGVWGSIGGVGATSGLLIGGPVTDGLGWEWVFFINVPVGLGVLALSPFILRESRRRAGRNSFDLAGALTITASLVLFVYAIAKAPETGWTDAQTIGLLAASAALVTLFAFVEARSVAPLVPLRMFRSRSLVGGNLVLLTAGMAIDGMLLTLALYAQRVLGYSPVQFGLMMAVMTVMSVIGAFSGQAIVTRTGFRPVAAAGMGLVVVACLVLAQVSVDSSYFGDVFVGLLIFGVGLGAAFTASQVAALDGVAEQDSGLAAGLVDTSFTVGGALGLAILSTVAAARTGNEGNGTGQPAQLLAMTEGLQSAFAMAAGFAGFGLIAAIVLLGPRHATGDACTHAVPAAPTDSRS